MRDGKFPNELAVLFEHNAADQTYRVVVWEWRRYFTADDLNFHWLAPGYGIFASYAGQSIKDHQRVFKAKHFERALRYYVKMMGYAAERKARDNKARETQAGWRQIA